MKRFLRIVSLASLVVVMLALCVACGAKPDATSDAKPDEKSVFERGTWALSTYKGRQAPYTYARYDYKFDYNERGQIVESRTSSDAVNIVNGQYLSCTWSDDGLSYECSYTLAMGNFGENSDSGTSKATFEVEYDELSATYTAHGERIPRIWDSGDSTVRYTLEYRADGTIKHKEIEGRESSGSLEVFDYDEHGNTVRYERTLSGEDAPWEIRTYDIAYEDDVPKSAIVTVTFPSKDVEGEAGSEEGETEDPRTYEIVLDTDDDGNVVSVEGDGWRLATMSWVYIENPDPLSRLRIHAEAASPFDLL